MNSIDIYMSNNYEKTLDGKGAILCADIFKNYLEWMKFNKYKDAPTKQEFFNRLKKYTEYGYRHYSSGIHITGIQFCEEKSITCLILIAVKFNPRTGVVTIPEDKILINNNVGVEFPEIQLNINKTKLSNTSINSIDFIHKETGVSLIKRDNIISYSETESCCSGESLESFIKAQETFNSDSSSSLENSSEHNSSFEQSLSFSSSSSDEEINSDNNLSSSNESKLTKSFNTSNSSSEKSTNSSEQSNNENLSLMSNKVKIPTIKSQKQRKFKAPIANRPSLPPIAQKSISDIKQNTPRYSKKLGISKNNSPPKESENKKEIKNAPQSSVVPTDKNYVCSPGSAYFGMPNMKPK